jgi:hypothetical protein
MNVGSKLPNTKYPPVTFTKNKLIPRGTSTRTVILLLQVVFPKAPTPNTEEARRKKTKETPKSKLILKFKT